VGRKEHCLPLLPEVEHQLAEETDPLRVQPVEDLVEEEVGGVAEEGGSQRESLLHPLGVVSELLSFGAL